MSVWSTDIQKRLVQRVTEEYMLHQQAREAEEFRKAIHSYLQKEGGMVRTAGEVRFVKDYGPEEDARTISDNYNFNPKAKKPLVKVLWSISCALGHLISAYSTFTKIKASNISPDGKLGGKGYVQDIIEMRKGFNETMAVLSAIQDTISDEINAPHWEAQALGTSDDDEAKIKEMLSDSEDIMEDPDEFVAEEYEEHVVRDVEKSNQ